MTKLWSMMIFLAIMGHQQQGVVHKRRRQFGGVGGFKIWSKLPTNSIKQLSTLGRGGVKDSENLPTSFMDGPQAEEAHSVVFMTLNTPFRPSPLAKAQFS